MKKRIRYVLLILFLIFIITGNIDYHFRVKHNKAPLFTIKIKDKYYGFGYTANKCGDDYKMATLLYRNVCVQSFDLYVDDFGDYEIIDKSEDCKTDLELIYADKMYEYYLECHKSDKIFLRYDSGKEYNLLTALKTRRTTVEDLINRKVNIYQKRINY